MYGYVFIVKNLESDKLYIGKNRSVKFDAKFVGNNEDLLLDRSKIGPHKFSCKMLMPYESEAELVAGEVYWLSKYGALNDPNFYNCKKVSEPEPVKKTRRTRKKSEES